MGIKFKLWAKNEWKLASLKVIEDYFKGTTNTQQLAPANNYSLLLLLLLLLFIFWLVS